MAEIILAGILIVGGRAFTALGLVYFIVVMFAIFFLLEGFVSEKKK